MLLQSLALIYWKLHVLTLLGNQLRNPKKQTFIWIIFLSQQIFM